VPASPRMNPSIQQKLQTPQGFNPLAKQQF
jgi:hypothetical protein